MAELLAYSKLGEFQRTTKTGAMINRFNSVRIDPRGTLDS